MQLKRFRCGEQFLLAVNLAGVKPGAVNDEERWIQLDRLPGLAHTGSDMLKVLTQWSQLKPVLDQALKGTDTGHLPDVPADAQPVAAFVPLSLRDFMLSEQHAVNAARGMVRHFMPRVFPVVQLFERISGRVFPALKPKPLWYQQPLYYFSNHLNVVGDDAVIDWPAYTRYLDYELELAFVLAQPLKNATPQQALAAIGGFLVLNDVSARDVQLAEMRSGFGPQKAKHFINALSYTVATADEVLPQVNQLRAEVRINGAVVCHTTTSGLQHSIADVLVHASREEQLHPGEVFGLGTLPGGCALENHHWLQPGDRIDLWIEGVGLLRNLIAASDGVSVTKSAAETR
jgi:2-keto-4-pentenoate hydratase/2-oxohepta-3-ene-1,7-dioic acid hydratase in catechol pathway